MPAAAREVNEDTANRRRQLKAWIDEHFDGIQAKFVHAHDLNQGEISGLMNSKSFGSVKARNLEKKAGMPTRYLDARTSAESHTHSGLPSSSSELVGRDHGVVPETFVNAGGATIKAGFPVTKTIRVKADDSYDEIIHARPEGFVSSFHADPTAYAVKVRGDGLAPAIKDGSFLIVEPLGTCVLGEDVLIELVDGRRLCKTLMFERKDTVTVKSPNSGDTMTIERAEMHSMLPVAAVYPPSKWRPT